MKNLIQVSKKSKSLFKKLKVSGKVGISVEIIF